MTGLVSKQAPGRVAGSLILVFIIFWLGWTLVSAWSLIVSQDWLSELSHSPKWKQTTTKDSNFDSVYTQAIIALEKIQPNAKVFVVWQNISFTSNMQYPNFITNFWLFPRKINVVNNIAQATNLKNGDIVIIAQDPGASSVSSYPNQSLRYKATDSKTQVEVWEVNK